MAGRYKPTKSKKNSKIKRKLQKNKQPKQKNKIEKNNRTSPQKTVAPDQRR
jgi:hypothetical protein